MALLETTSQLTFQGTIQYPAISIQQGSFTFITGKSGCGKSTYLRYLNGILPSEENQIFYREQPLSHYPILSYRKQVLLVPQSVYLLDASIRENFHFYYDSREQARLSDEEIQHFLSVCCLAATTEQLCSTLSGGERQRVFTAIFLSFAEDVLLLDEPTSALDEATAVQLFDSLKQYCKEHGLTVVCVCHSPHLVQQFADDTIHLGEVSAWKK